MTTLHFDLKKHFLGQGYFLLNAPVSQNSRLGGHR
jgi:hypothetical protein